MIDKDADRSTVRAGGRVGYRMTMRNRGRAIARNLRVCDHVPRLMTFVRADRKLRRLGRQRCLMIPRLRPGQRVSFHLVLQVSADAPQVTVANIGDITRPPATPGSPAERPRAGAPPRVLAKARAIVRGRAIVRILKRVNAKRPTFTG